MGRNLIPKLGEWRHGEFYDFGHTDGSPVLKSDDGAMVVYTMKRKAHGEEQVLATAWADGLQSLMAAMYEAGYRKGKVIGASEARKEILNALGIKNVA